jgi:acyl-CoA synthetase (AMP-forming)/AMP-acid ligase II
MELCTDNVQPNSLRSTEPKFTNSSVGQITLRDLVCFQSAANPEAPAIISPERKRLTYSQLLEQIDKTVEALNSFGVGRNDRIALALPNSPETAVAFLAVACGATCAPLNPAYRENEFDFYLSDLKAKAVIAPVGENGPIIDTAQKRGVAVVELIPLADTEAGKFELRVKQAGRPKYSGFAERLDVALTPPYFRHDLPA